MNLNLRQHLTRAAELLDAGANDAAGAILEPLVLQYPMDPFVLYNTGLWHWRAQRHQQAITYYRRALGANPNLLPALVNLGCSLMETGELRESVRYLQMALRRQPNDPWLLVNLSQALVGLGEAMDGLAAVEDALKIDPHHLPSLRQHMVALNELNRLRPALDAALAAINHPEGGDSVAVLSMLTSLAAKFSDWKLLDQYRPRLLEGVRHNPSALPPMALSFMCDDPALIGLLAQQRPKTTRLPPRPPRPSTAKQLTIGYMSPDLREHPVAQMLVDVLRHHDRSAFKILTVGTLPEDSSPVAKEIARLTDGHIDLTPLDDSAAASELRLRGVDVLVDLAGSTKWCRPGVLSRRPCPAQVLWLGCPCTTGADYYDAFLVDQVVAPPGYEQHCTEPLVRLPRCYHPISIGFGQVASGVQRKHFRLPNDKVIVGVLQQPAKIHPPFIDHVSRIIGRHANTHLWVRVHDDGVDAARQRIEANGLQPDHLHIAKLYKERSEYLAIYTLVDLIVDSFPYGGHSTTGEAIIQGTPVLTVRGQSIHSRVAASMLHELGLDELIFDDFQSLESALDHLLSNPDALAALKLRCSQAAAAYQKTGPENLARALEDAYRTLVAQAPTVPKPA